MDLLTLAISFFAGCFAACIGGGAAFVLHGLIGLVGVAALGSADATLAFGISFGPLLVPFCSYAAGVAALQYACRRGYTTERTNSMMPLISLGKYDVIIVGGLFAVIGQLVGTVSSSLLGQYMDTGSFSVLTVLVIAKLVFAPKEWLGVVSDEVKAVGGRFSPKAPGWGPFATIAAGKLVLGAIVAAFSAFMYQTMMASEALSAVAMYAGYFLFAFVLFLGIPPFFNIALVTTMTIAASGSIICGIAGGVLTLFICDLLSRLFSCHATGGYIDCVAASICTTSLITYGLLPMTGIYNVEFLFPIVVALVVLVAYFVEKKHDVKAISALEV